MPSPASRLDLCCCSACSVGSQAEGDDLRRALASERAYAALTRRSMSAAARSLGPCACATLGLPVSEHEHMMRRSADGRRKTTDAAHERRRPKMFRAGRVRGFNQDTDTPGCALVLSVDLCRGWS